MNPLLSLLLALAGAFFLSGGGALQWLGHERNGRIGPGGWKVAKVPCWWLGIACGAVGSICHYAALWVGLVALVLPVSSLHIVLTALAMSRLRKEAILGLRAVGIVLVSLGVGLCLAAEVGKTSERMASLPDAAICVALLCALGLANFLLRRPSNRFAAASGLAFASAAVSWKMLSLATRIPQRTGAATVFSISCAAGFLLMQAGFRRGGAGAVNATSTGTATVLAMVAAAFLFGEPVAPIAWIGTGCVAAGVAFIGWRRPDPAQRERRQE